MKVVASQPGVSSRPSRKPWARVMAVHLGERHGDEAVLGNSPLRRWYMVEPGGDLLLRVGGEPPQQEPRFVDLRPLGAPAPSVAVWPPAFVEQRLVIRRSGVPFPQRYRCWSL